MSDERAAPETRSVTVELPATVDLGPEIEGLAGRPPRMLRVTIEPGGVLGPVRDHRDRPGLVSSMRDGRIAERRAWRIPPTQNEHR